MKSSQWMWTTTVIQIVFLTQKSKICLHVYMAQLASEYCWQEKNHPVLFSPSWPKAKFKTGLIEVYGKDYVRKLESWWIQDWVNQSQICIGQK